MHTKIKTRFKLRVDDISNSVKIIRLHSTIGRRCCVIASD